MPRYAQIDAATVTGILIARVAPTRAPAGRTFVELLDDAQVVNGGDHYDAQTGLFTPPTPPVIVRQTTLDDLKALIQQIATKVGVT